MLQIILLLLLFVLPLCFFFFFVCFFFIIIIFSSFPYLLRLLLLQALCAKFTGMPDDEFGDFEQTRQKRQVVLWVCESVWEYV